MIKARIYLTLTIVMAVAASALAFKVNKQTKRLFYKTTIDGVPLCYTLRNLTTTTTTINIVAVPAGATGWYTTTLCTGPTFRAIGIAD